MKLAGKIPEPNHTDGKCDRPQLRQGGLFTKNEIDIAINIFASRVPQNSLISVNKWNVDLREFDGTTLVAIQ